MSKLASTLAGAVALVAFAACTDQQLIVTNQNNPDELRALARPGDVENLVGSQFRVIHNVTDGAVLTINGQLLVMGMENFSGLANAGMGPAGAVPRSSVDNSRGNQTLSEKYSPYLNIYAAARAVAMALNRLNQPGFTFFPTSIPQQRRDQAFAWFEIGVAMGDIALVYDSGAVVSPYDDLDVLSPFVGHDSLMTVALADLDSAIAYATPGASAFPLPGTWINGNALTSAQFIALCRSWKARLRAGVARTPAERAAVDWTKVIADASAGITADFNITMVTAAPAWGYRPVQMDLFSSWHQMTQYWIGMADTSGAYAAYLATPAASRAPFLILTPDLRFPSGATRAVQNTNSGCGASGCVPPNANIFFRNRLAGADTPGDPLGFSMYDYYRNQTYFNAPNNRNGPIRTMTLAEMNLLMAEGYIRTGQTALAAAKIDVSRALRGLRTLAGIVTDTIIKVPGQDGVPGSNSCVPRIPVAPFNTAACGNIMEAMKWEKRMETAYTHWGAWWVDGRGWGDLPANTPLQYPTPYQELDTRLKTIYTYSTGAAAGKYGL